MSFSVWSLSLAHYVQGSPTLRCGLTLQSSRPRNGHWTGHWTGVPRFIFRSPVHVRSGCFQFLTIMNNAAVDIQVQVFAFTSLFNSLMHIPGGRIVVTLGLALGTLLNCFQSGCATLHAHHRVGGLCSGAHPQELLQTRWQRANTSVPV